MSKIYDYFISNVRAFPCTVTVFSIVSGILFKNKVTLFFGIYIYICDCIAMLLKKGTSLLYKFFNTDYLPILGYGTRPKGAKHCGCFITESNLEGITKSYGMPSGHSIMASLTLTFWVLYFLDNIKNVKKRNHSIFLLGLICSSVIISRVYLKCHTIQQVIIGSLIGAIFGYIGYKYIYLKYKYLSEFNNTISLDNNDKNSDS